MIYFLSDAHLGSLATTNCREQEMKLVRFLDDIKEKAEAVYLLGDMFDFWYEYRHVVPKGFTRFLGKLSELTDRGIEVHFFIGNHDLWAYSYLAEECGVILHREAEVIELHGKKFYMSHGDSLGDPDKKYRFLRSVFHNKTCQRLFSILHPDLGMAFGLAWAKHSRLKRPGGQEPPYMGEKKEHLVVYAKEYLKEHPEIDYFVFGHRHIELDLTIPNKERKATSRLLLLGDWISKFTYAEFDGQRLLMGNIDDDE